MIKKQETFNLSLVFDGKEEEYFGLSIMGNYPITNFQSISSLKSVIGTEAFSKLLLEIEAEQVLPFDTYQHRELQLPMRWLEIRKNNLPMVLIIIAGERQPGRFQLYLHSTWILNYS
jgi:hypothetical protein